jgi:hypothetical protein
MLVGTCRDNATKERKRWVNREVPGFTLTTHIEVAAEKCLKNE